MTYPKDGTSGRIVGEDMITTEGDVFPIDLTSHIRVGGSDPGGWERVEVWTFVGGESPAWRGSVRPHSAPDSIPALPQEWGWAGDTRMDLSVEDDPDGAARSRRWQTRREAMHAILARDGAAAIRQFANDPHPRVRYGTGSGGYRALWMKWLATPEEASALPEGAAETCARATRSPDVLAALAQHPSGWVRSAVAGNRHTKEEDVILLAGDPDTAFHVVSRREVSREALRRAFAVGGGQYLTAKMFCLLHPGDLREIVAEAWG